MIIPIQGFTPPKQDIINLITEKKPAIVQQVKPELTVEEKIRTNYYKCKEDIEWIRADDATCLPKQPQYTTQAQGAVKTAPSSSQGNLYEYKSCTWWVKQWKPEVGNWGDAQSWGYAAQAEGWTVNDAPVVGAVAWSTRGYYGHVGLVIGVAGGNIILQEGNYDWNGSVRTTTVPIDSYRYIH